MLVLSAGIAPGQSNYQLAVVRDSTRVANSTADAIRRIEYEWADTSRTKNANKLGEILTDGWVGLDSSGNQKDKSKVLSDLRSSLNVVESIDVGPMNVRVFGKTAVVTGSTTEKSTENGKDSSGRYVWTDVFVKQHGKWRAVASQSIKLPR